jgi:uncharacterized protein YndB with AHSA1/START domain
MTTPQDDPREIRSIEVEVEVPGTPEQVWEAIATGPGIACWFVPAEVAEHEGGSIALDMGAGLQETGKVRAWDPPRRFASEEDWQFGDDAPAARLATEWLVEARSGDSCVVRLVSSLFASGGEWDRELGSMREGWEMFLRKLRLYLTHFAGRRAAHVIVSGGGAGPLDRAWAALAEALGLAEVAEGEQTAATAAGAPALAGTVERVMEDDYHHGLILRTEEPAPGVVLVFVNSWRGQVRTNVHAHFYGDEAPAVAAHHEPVWRAWMEEHSPVATSEAAAAKG